MNEFEMLIEKRILLVRFGILEAIFGSVQGVNKKKF